MTTDPTPDRQDPLSALDAVEPPDRWEDVVARSTDGELLDLAPVAAHRSMPRPLLAAAAVLVVVALGAGVFALTRGDDGTQNLATDGDGGSSGAAAIWNSTWELVALERDGQDWAVEPAGETNPQLTTTQPGPGAIAYQACNGGTGTATVDGDRLVRAEFAMTAMGCMSEDGSMTFMDQEVFVTELLGDRPTIAITGPEADRTGDGFDSHGIGDRLTLTTAKGSATFERTAIGSTIEGGTDGDQPQALWGRMWVVVNITDGGQERRLVHPDDQTPLRLDATTAGSADFNGCHGAGGLFDLDGNRLIMTEAWTITGGRCASDGLMDQEEWLQAFLETKPTVLINGNHLTLTIDQAAIEFEAADAAVGRPIGPEGPEEPEDTESSPPQPQFGPVDPGTSGSSSPQGPVGSDGPATSVSVGPVREPDETSG